MIFLIFKDDGVTNGRVTNGTGATTESQCGMLLPHIFTSCEDVGL